MLKRLLLALLALLLSFAALAATEVNRASVAELESIKGIGPALAARIIDERQKRDFTNWADLVARVKGLGAGNAARLSADGLTVQGASYPSPAKE